MSDKFNILTSNIIRFVAGERPTADKFNAMNLYYTRAVDNICRAIGDMHDRSAHEPLSPQWNPNEVDLEGRPLDIANLARLIGPASNLNPKMFGSEYKTITEIFTKEDLEVSKEISFLYNNWYGNLELKKLNANDEELEEVIPYTRINHKTILLENTFALSEGEKLKAAYATFANGVGGGTNYSNASFNTIPDPNEESGLTNNEISDISEQANGWVYKIDLSERKIKNQQSGSHELSSSSVERQDEFNNDTAYSLPEWWVDKFNLNGQIERLPSGLIYLKNIETGEIYLTAEYAASDISTVYIRSANLCLEDEHRLILVGTDITTSIDDLRNKMFNHRHDGSFGEPFIRIQDLIGKFVTGEFGPSSIPGNEFPMYLHRKGYQTDTNALNGNNAMLGDLFMGNYFFDGSSNTNIETSNYPSHKILFGNSSARIWLNAILVGSDRRGGLEISYIDSVMPEYGNIDINCSNKLEINAKYTDVNTLEDVRFDQKNLTSTSSSTTTITSNVNNIVATGTENDGGTNIIRAEEGNYLTATNGNTTINSGDSLLINSMEETSSSIDLHLMMKKSHTEEDYPLGENLDSYYQNIKNVGTRWSRDDKWKDLILETRASIFKNPYSYEINFVPDGWNGSRDQSELTPCFLDNHGNLSPVNDTIFLSTAMSRLFIRNLRTGTLLDSDGTATYWSVPHGEHKSVVHYMPYLNGNYKFNYWQSICFPKNGNVTFEQYKTMSGNENKTEEEYLLDSDYNFPSENFRDVSNKNLGVILWESASSTDDDVSYLDRNIDKSHKKIITFGNQKKVSFRWGMPGTDSPDYYNYFNIDNTTNSGSVINFGRGLRTSVQDEDHWWKPSSGVWEPSINSMDITAIMVRGFEREDSSELDRIDMGDSTLSFGLRLRFLNTILLTGGVDDWDGGAFTDEEDQSPDASDYLKYYSQNLGIKITRPEKELVVGTRSVTDEEGNETEEDIVIKVGGISWMKGISGMYGGTDTNVRTSDVNSLGSEFDFRLTAGPNAVSGHSAGGQPQWLNLDCVLNVYRMGLHRQEIAGDGDGDLQDTKIYELMKNWVNNDTSDYLKIEICWVPTDRSLPGSMVEKWIWYHDLMTSTWSNMQFKDEGKVQYALTIDGYGVGSAERHIGIGAVSGDSGAYSFFSKTNYVKPNSRFGPIQTCLTSDFVGVGGQYIVFPRMLRTLNVGEEKKYNFTSIIPEQDRLKQNLNLRSKDSISINKKERFYIGKLALIRFLVDMDGTDEYGWSMKEWVDFPNLILDFIDEEEGVDTSEYGGNYLGLHYLDKNNNQESSSYSHPKDEILKIVNIDGLEVYSGYLKKIDLSGLLKVHIFKNNFMQKYFSPQINGFGKDGNSFKLKLGQFHEWFEGSEDINEGDYDTGLTVDKALSTSFKGQWDEDGSNYRYSFDSDFFKLKALQNPSGTLTFTSNHAYDHDYEKSKHYMFGYNFNLDIVERKINSNLVVIDIKLLCESEELTGAGV